MLESRGVRIKRSQLTCYVLQGNPTQLDNLYNAKYQKIHTAYFINSTFSYFLLLLFQTSNENLG